MVLVMCILLVDVMWMDGRIGAQTDAVDWLSLGLMASSLLLGVALIAVVARVGIKMSRRRNGPSPTRRADGEYQPPEPPEGRYWG
jgi:hypothetical protein